MGPERLQKIIAAAGIASRRSAEKLIASGAVSVNGQIVTELGTKADPERDHIRVNGKLLHGAERQVYLLMNKPKGYVTTVSDPEGRPTVMDLLRGIRVRVYPVGRLDYASEGLLLLTNDGELAHKLMKAASHVPKVYVVKVAGVPDVAGLEKLRKGLSIPVESRLAKSDIASGKNKSRFLDSGSESASGFITSARNDRRKGRGGRRVRTAPAKVRLIREGENPWYEVTLTEGKNRQIRRMFEEIGHHVEKIKRVRYGSLSLDLPPGQFRRLSMGEIEKLKTAAGERRNQ
ncbi:MAG TPA: pseudouridine synthase [Terriglobales bacterium]|jgi:23S rRNA pseudouridine2605 synthase